ncbi:MAG TPA: acetate/propionate family kinase [Fimbriimonas sp.]|nr:acetate/propionate family kinase [Fimbriimonas sp.]
MKVLSLNAGSSSLKFAAFSAQKEGQEEILRGSIENLGTDHARLNISSSGAAGGVPVRTLGEAVGHVLSLAPRVDAVGCRVVHGGTRFTESALVDDGVIEAIKELAPLAPLHNAHDVEVLNAVRKARAGTPVVAVFDTAFHRTLPDLARRYALPEGLDEVRRFGFHGISYQYISNRMKEVLAAGQDRLIVCHLGNGSSVCAIKDGQSMETSMGMTPLEGLVMGTRSGDLDPGALLYLLREKGMSEKEVDDLLNRQSGLLGVSGLSSDVRELETAATNGNRQAAFALDLFAYRVAKYVGAYSVVLDGFDALVFSGGIGQHSHRVRSSVCSRLASLGVGLPAEANDSKTLCRLSVGRPSVWVARTDEEWQIAAETREPASFL